MNDSKKELIEHFFSYLSHIGNPQNKADAISLQNYVTENFTIQSNNEVVCQGISECMDYINRMQEKYKNVSYSDFLETPIITEERAVIHFQVKCTSKMDSDDLLDAIAILTFQNGKIRFWKEVFHSIIKH